MSTQVRCARALGLTLGLPLLLAGCAGPTDAASQGANLDAEVPPYASELVSFEPGEHAGYGQDEMPEVVLGAPKDGGPGKGSLDVVALGMGGEIVLGFGERVIVDGDGPDFVVFENAFWAGGDPDMPFSEPGEVAVSEDGETWHTFSCDPMEPGGGSAASGCAGIDPTFDFDTDGATLDPEQSGGDAFDLAQLTLARARFVRIRDLSEDGDGNNAGFDLDAVGVVHWERDE